MVILRRRRAPSAQPVTQQKNLKPTTKTPPPTDEKRMWKVWLKGKKGEGIVSSDPYWYVDTTSAEYAKAFMARELRRKIKDFEAK